MKPLNELIDPRLWSEVKRNYLQEQYTNAVLDGVQFLSDLIREMSGEDGDGVSLVSRAFNPKSPKIKVNRLKTTTEKDIQKGIMFLLQGFYSAIRNERVHEKKEDSEEDAVELILFINHIQRIIDKSTGKFTIENTLKRIFDKNFLAKEEYINHIIDEIPITKRFEVSLEVFRNRQRSVHLRDLSIFWGMIKKDLSDEEAKDLIAEISVELRYTDNSKDVASIIELLGSDWSNVEQDSKLRSENLLIKSIPSYLSDDPRDGPHASEYKEEANAIEYLYSNNFLELKNEFAEKVYSTFKRGGLEMSEYIIDHFGIHLIELEKHALFESLKDILIEKVDLNYQVVKNFVERDLSNLDKDLSIEIKNHIITKKRDMDNLGDGLPF